MDERHVVVVDAAFGRGNGEGSGMYWAASAADAERLREAVIRVLGHVDETHALLVKTLPLAECSRLGGCAHTRIEARGALVAALNVAARWEADASRAAIRALRASG